MALDATKWQFGSNRGIRYIGGAHGSATANYVSVYELHRWLQDLADDASAAGDDLLDITKLNPSDKKFTTIIELLNAAFLDDAYATPASEFIYGGSIIQTVSAQEEIYDGISVVANRGVVVNVIQNGAVLANKFWNNTPNGETFAGINPDAANGVAMRFMVKVKSAGSMIDNGALLFTTREWNKTFSEFRIPSLGRGVNVVPLQYADDLNNATVIGDLAGAPFTDVSLTTAGFKLIDVNNDTTDEEYYSEWNRGACSINQFYEAIKYKTRNGETATLYGIPGQLFRGITHSVAYSVMAGGEFSEGAEVTWGSGATAGTGQVLANDQTDNILYIQLKTGVVPSANTISQTGGKTATAGAVVERPISAPVCGASTGSSLVGAYGFSLEYADLAVTDKIQALDGVTRNPPNNVQFTVNGVANGWRVLVGPDAAGVLDSNQLTVNGALSGAAVTSVVVNEVLTTFNIPASTAASGGVSKLRIKRASGVVTSHAYSAVNTGTKTFTITAADFSTDGVANGADAFVAYIDAVATGASIPFNTIQSTPQTLFVEARFGGTGPSYTDSIKPSKTTGALGSTGGSATISSVSDA